MTNDSNDALWEVLLDGGAVRLLSLEALDAAFERGEISEQTLVRQQGEPSFRPLGELAGIEEEPALAAPEPLSITPPPVSATPLSVAPVAFDMPSEPYAAASLDGGRRSRVGLIASTLVAASVVGFLVFAGVYARASIVEAVTGVPAQRGYAAQPSSPARPLEDQAEVQRVRAEAEAKARTEAEAKAGAAVEPEVSSMSASALPDTPPAKRAKGKRSRARSAASP